MDLTDICRIFHPTTAQYTFFSAAHGPFSKTNHILGHKESLSKYKKKLQLNNKSNSRKHANNWRLNNSLLNDQWVIAQIREEIKFPRS
jgi:hypothetical protein